MGTYTNQAPVDTFLAGSAHTTNSGTGDTVYCGNYYSDSVKMDRALFKWTWTSADIPTNAVVTSATITITIAVDYSANARDFSAYRMLKNWVEEEATWHIYSAGNNWTTEGGIDAADCEAVAIATTAFTATEAVDSTKVFTLTNSKVQEWVTGATANYGVMIRPATEYADEYGFYSAEWGTAGKRPLLTINYVIPGGESGTFFSGGSTLSVV